MPLSGATYNASAFTVTLLTRKTLALNPPLNLTVQAASLLDALGRKLDGNNSGHPGATSRPFEQGRGHRHERAGTGASRRPLVPGGRCRVGRGLPQGSLNSVENHQSVPFGRVFRLPNESRRVTCPSIRAELDYYRPTKRSERPS